MGSGETSAMSLGQLLSQGGWAMVPIYACSVAALAVFLRKVVELRAVRRSDLNWLERVLDRVRIGDLEGARRACDGSLHPASVVLRATLDALENKPERAEAEARRVGSLELQKLEGSLVVLSFIAQVAPLLGLLGTVLGMVDLFIGLQGAGHNVAVSDLAAGIWKALLTTAAGLTVAVPALAAYTYLTSQTDGIRLQLSDAVQQTLYAMPDAKETAEADDGV